jgi:TctA family transporter
MKGDPSELSERERNLARDELIIPTGEFVALFTGALLTLGLLAGPRTLVSAAKVVYSLRPQPSLMSSLI